MTKKELDQVSEALKRFAIKRKKRTDYSDEFEVHNVFKFDDDHVLGGTIAGPAIVKLSVHYVTEEELKTSKERAVEYAHSSDPINN